MKHAFSRVAVLLLAVLMLVSLCACGTDATTTTTNGDAATTTVADDVTTTVGDTDPTEDSADPTEGDTDPTDVDPDPTTVGNVDAATTTKKPATTTTAEEHDAWGEGATRPVRTTKSKTQATDAATTADPALNYTNTMASINRDSKYANDQGIYHVLKGYCWGSVYKASEWLPVVGYVKDGKVVDTLYTATTIMPSPNNIYHGDFRTKKDWDSWREHTYDNLETLNEAARSVQDALQLKEYKIKVFLTLSNPDKDINNEWGKLNGVSMSAADWDERYAMIKYMIDSYISEMSTKDYANIEFTGFYWFDEYIESADLAWYKRVTDYIHSLGKITIISPYYKASGWSLCDEAGFDLHSMQSNYFPTGTVGIMNCGTDKRLEANAAEINAGNIGGIEMEMDSTNHKDAITGWKKTLKVGLESGIVNGYHIHYMGNGPRSVYTIAKSNDPYFRSAYDETYKYMHNKLTVDEIVLDPIENEQKWADGFKEWN